MNPKTTLGLAVAFLLCVATLWFVKYLEMPTAEEREKMKSHVLEELYAVEADDVAEVTLKRGDEELHFARRPTGEQWQMTKPLDVLADASRVRAIVTAIKDLKRKTSGRGGDQDKAVQSVFECKDSELPQYNLDNPSKTVTLKYKPRGSKEATAEATILVGGKTADEDGVYVKRPDKPFVYVVSKFSLDSLDKTKAEFRERGLVTISRFDADQVRLQWPDRVLAGEKRDAKWRLTEPIADRADRAKFDELVGKFAEVKAADDKDFVVDTMDDPAKYGFDKPQLVIEISKDSIVEEKKEDDKKADDKKKSKDEEKKKEPFTEKVLIGSAAEGREGKVYARLADQNYVVAVPASILSDLNKQPNDVRSRDLVDVSDFDVDFISVERPDDSLRVAKKDFDWQIYQPKKLEADRPAVDELLKKVNGLEIKEFLDEASAKDYELEQPAATVTLYEKGLKEDTADKDKKDDKDADKKDEQKDEKTDTPPEPKGTPVKVLFGKRDAEKKLIYAQRAGEPAIFAVADDGLWDILSRGYLAYRRKNVLDVSSLDVAKLSVHRDGKTFSVERKKEKEGDVEKWRLTEPVDAPADAGSIDDILFRFRPLNAAKFIAEGASDLKPYGLDSPPIRATITMKAEADKEPKQNVLLVGDQVEGTTSHYAKLGDGDLVFTVDETLVKDLRGELHDHSVLKFDTFKADGLTLTWADGSKLELQNKKPEATTPATPAKEWSIVGEAAFKLDAQKVKDLVNMLAAFTTDSFAQYQGDFKEEHGLAKPALQIDVKVEGETAPKTLRVGAAAEGENRYVASAEKAGPVAVVLEGRFKDILAGPSHFAAAEEKKEPAKPDEAKKEEAKPNEKKSDADKAETKKPDTSDTSKSKPEEKAEPKPDDKKPVPKPDQPEAKKESPGASEKKTDQPSPEKKP